MTITSIATRLILVAACFFAAFTAGTIAHAESASASVPSHTRLWWDGQTCRQWAAWGRQPTAERFRHLAADATHADGYLRTDVGGWAELRAHHAPRTVIQRWGAFVAMDCAGSYGL